jgi:hypothetical protein
MPTMKNRGRHGRPDRLRAVLQENPDLFPIFAEFAEAKVPDGVENKSIVRLPTGKLSGRRRSCRN